jgi:tetratricopeptide (TPR) repeat protein
LSIVVEKILREDNKVERDLAVRAECQISNVYRVVIGDTKKALSTAKEAIKMCRKKGFFKSEALVKPNVEASAIACLASALELNGKIKEAERELNRALKVVPSDARVDKARYRQNLAGLVRKKGDLREAMKLYSDVLKEFESIYGKDTPNKYIAATLVNMGAVYIQTADYRKAQEAMHRALDIFKNLYGEKPHPHVVAVNTALGNIYEAREKIPRAREYREKSLKMSYELYVVFERGLFLMCYFEKTIQDYP